MRSELQKDWFEFIHSIEVFSLTDGDMIFRGQNVCRNLLPGIARGNPNFDTREREEQMLNQLALLGAPHLSSAPTVVDQLITAQHFKMKTRLLDWTDNPLIALWFACSSRGSDGTPVYVYALRKEGLTEANFYSMDPFGFDSPKVFQPRLNNPRVIAQHGWFTLHSFSNAENRWIPLEDDRSTQDALVEIQIPDSQCAHILEALDRLGISIRTVYPDLEGVCQYINWKLLHSDTCG